MNPREQIEAALAQARADREKAAAERARAGTEWRKQEDAAKVTNVTYNQVRSAWVRADAEWNRANALVDKLAAELKDLERTETLVQQRAALEAVMTKARSERDQADAALAAVARARAEREKSTAAAPVPVERRRSETDRRRPGSDRRKHKGERRSQQARPDTAASAAKEWNDAVTRYNKADAEWNRARAALAEFNRLHSKK